jgi:hypothetical protein
MKWVNPLRMFRHWHATKKTRKNIEAWAPGATTHMTLELSKRTGLEIKESEVLFSMGLLYVECKAGTKAGTYAVKLLSFPDTGYWLITTVTPGVKTSFGIVDQDVMTYASAPQVTYGLNPEEED